MAKINNQAVIQKLIDELRLYPGTDAIPTELAEKILPVYQINTEVLEVSPKPANIVRSITITGTGTTTLYTTPATGDFFLTNCFLSIAHNPNGAFGGTRNAILRVTIDGVAQTLLRVAGVMDAGQAEADHADQAYNLQNPIKVDKGTAITCQVQGVSVGEYNVGIVGYTST